MMNKMKTMSSVLFALVMVLALGVAAMAQTGTMPLDLTSQVATGQGQVLSYLGIIFAAAVAITAAFTGAKVFMKWSSARAKSS